MDNERHNRSAVETSRVAFTGRIFTVAVDRVRLPHGTTVEMEVVRHPVSVILIPVDSRRSHHPRQAVPLRGRSVVMGASSGERGPWRNPRSGRHA